MQVIIQILYIRRGGDGDTDATLVWVMPALVLWYVFSCPVRSGAACPVRSGAARPVQSGIASPLRSGAECPCGQGQHVR